MCQGKSITQTNKTNMRYETFYVFNFWQKLIYAFKLDKSISISNYAMRIISPNIKFKISQC